MNKVKKVKSKTTLPRKLMLLSAIICYLIMFSILLLTEGSNIFTLIAEGGPTYKIICVIILPILASILGAFAALIVEGEAEEEPKIDENES